LALSVPLSRFTPRVGGGSAFFVRRHSMRSLILTFWLAVIPFAGAFADQPPFASVIKASLLFHEDTNSACKYLHLVAVSVRLENLHTSDVTWVGDFDGLVRAEVFDSKGIPLHRASVSLRMMSAIRPYSLPVHSSQEWPISRDPDGSISVQDEVAAKGEYALMIGGNVWLIPADSLASWSLRLTVRGWPWITTTTAPDWDWKSDQELFTIPPTPILLK
jgi:hypothetical protein